MFSLIKDQYVQLNTQFVLPASDGSDAIANVSTFLGTLGLLLRCPVSWESVAVKVSAQDHTLQISGETVTAKNVPVQVVINSDFIITTKIVYDEV